MQESWIRIHDALPVCTQICLIFWATDADHEFGEHWGHFIGYYDGKKWIKGHGKDFKGVFHNENVDIENVRQWQFIKYPKHF